MPALALPVGEPANGEQVRALEQTDAVVEREPEAGLDFVGDIRHSGCREALQHVS